MISIMPDQPSTISNNDLIARSLSAVWHPCSQMKHHEDLPLLPIARGKGAWLFDSDNKRYLDAISSWWVNLFGHCNPDISSAVCNQLEALEHVMLAGFTHEPVVLLSEKLREIAPTGLGHCFYASDGASAIEITLKMSAHFWHNNGKTKKIDFISLSNSYHGETLGALSVTDVALFRDAYGMLIRQHSTVPSPDSRNAVEGESSEAYALRCADALEAHLQKHHDQLAAFVIEPLVQGAAGMAMYHPAYLQRARSLCDEYEVHLIADEIAVGFGRTGTMFACEQASTYGVSGKTGITPDFLCLSKGITGGYLPLSVVMTRDKIYQTFYDDDVKKGFLHSHSYTGNPLACSAALATLDIFSRDNILTRNRDKAAHLNQISQPLREHRSVRNWRNTGMIWAFEVDTPHDDFARKCFALALNQELLLRPIGKTVYFMPPYIIDNDEIEHLVSSTLRIVDQLS